MFDIPGLETMSSILGGSAPAFGGLGAGMGAGGVIAEAASSAWDFGSNAIANIGPSLIGGPFMPSLGGGGSAGAGAAGGQAASPLPLGLIDDRDMASASADFAPEQQDWLY